MTERAFEQVNYSLRPNKSVERRLLIRLLARLAQTDRFNIQAYRYIGFGSMWYADMILMHKQLGIADLVSIEKEVTRERRAKFNKPFSCITPVMGASNAKLQEIAWNKPTILWLDYNSVLSLDIFRDIEITLPKMKSGDLLFVSVNSFVKQLTVKDFTQLQVLQQVCPNEDIPTDASRRLNASEFPALVGEILLNRMCTVSANSFKDETFLPLLNITYADDAPMVTVGGCLLNQEDKKIVEDLKLSDDYDFVSASCQYEIALPQLTFKEKLTLDQFFPCATSPDPEELPFELRPSELEAYRKLYLYYPLYGELYL